MYCKKTLSALASAVALAASSNSWALDPEKIDFAGMYLEPTLKVSESYDDNIHTAETDEQSSWVTTITPTFVLGARDRLNEYKLTYSANSDIFHSDHSNDNTDHHLTANADMEFDARNRLALNAGYHKVEDTADTELTNAGDMYTTKNVGGLYSFGAKGAKGQIDLGADYKELRYDNSGDRNNQKEYDATALKSIFYYRVTPKTRALAELRHTDYDYVESDSLFDATNDAWLLGATWDATAKTTGSAKFGREYKNFDDSSVDDRSNAMWEVGVTWSPLSYSKFGLNSRSAIEEADSGATAIEVMSTTLDWKHEWTSLLYSKLYYTYSEKDYMDTEREDELNVAGVSFTYAMRRWLDLEVGYRYMDNDSNTPDQSYERNVYLMSVSASL